MRKLRVILPTLLVLACISGLAVAQTFTRALQLSQDTSGAYLVDNRNNLYLPNKLMFPTGGVSVTAPTVTGTGSPTIAGTDAAGLITMGTSATTAIALFGTAYGAVPNCVLSNQATGQASPISYTIVATSISIVQTSQTANKINYFCTGTTS